MPFIENSIFLVWILYFFGVWISRCTFPNRSFRSFLLIANLTAFYFSFIHSGADQFSFFSVTVAAAGLLFSYWLLKNSQNKTLHPYFAVLAPYLTFVIFRSSSTLGLLGQSFLCIRLSYLAFEVLYREEELPSLKDYITYAFFLPTSVMGPVNPYSQFKENLDSHFSARFSSDMFYRFWFGLVKAFPLSSIAYNMSFRSFQDHLDYNWIEFIIAGIFYYVALYLKFSGICDIVITMSYFLGFDIRENFMQPLLSRNIQDHWRRWHVSLLDYFREVVFLPLSIALQRRWGTRFEILIVILLTFFIFTLISIWHGQKWEYLAFGWLHALGVSAVILYDKFLKRWLGKRHAQYRASRMAHMCAWFVTLIYISFTYIAYVDIQLIEKLFQ